MNVYNTSKKQGIFILAKCSIENLKDLASSYESCAVVCKLSDKITR